MTLLLIDLLLLLLLWLIDLMLLWLIDLLLLLLLLLLKLLGWCFQVGGTRGGRRDLVYVGQLRAVDLVKGEFLRVRLGSLLGGNRLARSIIGYRTVTTFKGQFRWLIVRHDLF